MSSEITLRPQFIVFVRYSSTFLSVSIVLYHFFNSKNFCSTLESVSNSPKPKNKTKWPKAEHDKSEQECNSYKTKKLCERKPVLCDRSLFSESVVPIFLFLKIIRRCSITPKQPVKQLFIGCTKRSFIVALMVLCEEYLF